MTVTLKRMKDSPGVVYVELCRTSTNGLVS